MNLLLSPSISKHGKSTNAKFSYITGSQDYKKPPTPKTYKQFSLSVKDQMQMRGFKKTLEIEPLVKFNFLDWQIYGTLPTQMEKLEHFREEEKKKM